MGSNSSRVAMRGRGPAAEAGGRLPQRVGHDAATTILDATTPPVLQVQSGESFIVDCRSLLTDGPFDEHTDVAGLSIPVTGPIRVAGATTGDVLRVDVEQISIADVGAMVTLPGRGGFTEPLEKAGHMVEISDGLVHFDEATTVPVRPMIGKLGLAPAAGEVDSSTVGVHGGNMDCPELVAGTSVLLPVQVAGGLLHVGDLHAAQGHGESCLTGVEVEGVVTLRCTVLSNLSLARPIVLTPDRVLTVGDGADLDEAAAHALDDMLAHLVADRGWPRTKAAMFLSAAGDVAVAQLVNARASVTMSVPRSSFTSGALAATSNSPSPTSKDATQCST